MKKFKALSKQFLGCIFLIIGLVILIFGIVEYIHYIENIGKYLVLFLPIILCTISGTFMFIGSNLLDFEKYGKH